MGLLKDESKPPSIQYLLLAFFILLSAVVLIMRLSSPVRGDVATERASVSPISKAAEANRLFNEAYITWRIKHNFAESQRLYTQLFDENAGSPFMHIAYADMLSDNGKNEAAVSEYRVALVDPSRTSSPNECQPAIMARYAAACRACKKDQEADWVERQIVLTAGKRYEAYPAVTQEQLAKLPVSAMAELARGLELEEQKQDARAEQVFLSVIQQMPNLALAHYYRARNLERQFGTGTEDALVEYNKATRLDATLAYGTGSSTK